jgi:putative tricarboxylic transport membrane protein
MKRTILVLAVLFLSLSVLMANGTSEKAGAGDWVKNVEIQVPATAGGGTDVMARTLGTYVSKAAENNLTIINNTDGGGVVAMEKVRTARPNGSVLLHFHTTMLIKSAIGIYNRTVADDFTVIGVSQAPNSDGGYILLVNPNSDITTLDALIKKAKANPGQLLAGVETGGSSHIMSGLFAKAAGINLKFVEAGPDTEKLTALVGKNIDLCFVNPNQARQYVQSGRGVALGMIPRNEKDSRSSVLPDIPTFPEQGLNFSFTSLIFVLGPKNMDSALVKKIHDYYAAASKDEEVNKILKPAGFVTEFFSIEEGAAKVKAQQEEISVVARELGLAN